MTYELIKTEKEDDFRGYAVKIFSHGSRSHGLETGFLQNNIGFIDDPFQSNI